MDEESERTSPDARDDLAVDSDTCRLDSLKDAAHDAVMSARDGEEGGAIICVHVQPPLKRAA